ncbi:MAG: oligosaccharide flippase family protein [Anaerolineales bacterium]|nr:oligosaccharide flippase family protein [Anaerolineales bacterium]
MFKRFIKDSAIYGVALMLARGVSILLLPLYTHVLAPADYGIVDLLTPVINFMGILLPLEIAQALYRIFPDAESEEEKTAFASSAMWFVVAVHIIFIGVMLPFASHLAVLLLRDSSLGIYIILGLATLLAIGPYNLTVLLLRCQFQAVAFSITNLVFTLASIGFSILFVLILRMGIIGVLIGNALGYFVGLALAFFFARQNYRLVFSPAKLKEMLRFSVPLVPSSAGYFIMLYFSRPAIALLRGLADVGLFGIAARLVSPIPLAVNAFSGSLTPLIYSRYREESTPAEIARIFRVFFAGCMVLLLGTSLFSLELLHIFTAPDYYAAANLIPMMAVSAIISGLYLFTPGLAIAKKTGIIAVLYILSGVLNIGLNYLLIPFLGVVGAALATLLSVFINFVLSMYFSQKYYPVPHQWMRFVSGFVVTICAIGPGLLFKEITIWSIGIKTILVLAALPGYYLLGLVRKDELVSGYRLLRSYLAKIIDNLKSITRL